jgi:hypothetical protein
MASPFVVSCSACGSKLKLKDASAVGKKVKCPKCQEAFVVPAPQKQKAVAAKKKPADEDSFLDDLGDEEFGGSGDDDVDDFGDDDFEESAPRKKSGGGTATKKSKGKSKKKGRSSGNGGKIALIAGAIVLGMGLIGGGIYGIVLLASGASANRLAWVPDNAEFVAEIRPARIWNSQFLQPLTGGDAGTQITTRLQSTFGATITDIDRIVIAGASSDAQPTVVIYSNVALSASTVGQGSTATDYNGHTLYTSASSPTAYLTDDNKTLVFAQDATLRAMIDKNGATTAADKFGDLPSSGDIAFAASNFNSSSPFSQGMMMGPGAQDLASLQSVYGRGDFSSNLDLDISMVFSDAGVAERSVADFGNQKQQQLDQLTQQESQLASMPPNPFMSADTMRTMLQGQRQILESTTVSNSGGTLNVRSSVPGSIIAGVSSQVNMFLPAILESLPVGGSSGSTTNTSSSPSMPMGGGHAGGGHGGMSSPPPATAPSLTPGGHGGHGGMGTTHGGSGGAPNPNNFGGSHGMGTTHGGSGGAPDPNNFGAAHGMGQTHGNAGGAPNPNNFAPGAHGNTPGGGGAQGGQPAGGGGAHGGQPGGGGGAHGGQPGAGGGGAHGGQPAGGGGAHGGQPGAGGGGAHGGQPGAGGGGAHGGQPGGGGGAHGGQPGAGGGGAHGGQPGGGGAHGGQPGAGGGGANGGQPGAGGGGAHGN